VIKVERLRFTVVLHGNNGAVRKAIDRVGCPWQWNSRQRVYMVPATSAPDVLAALDLDGCHVAEGVA
jgi:hypothetical protein